MTVMKLAPTGTSALRGYGLAVLFVAAAMGLKVLLDPLLDGQISPLYFVAVMFSGIYGGLGPALLATVLSAVATAYLTMGNTLRLDLGFDDVVRLIVFTIAAFVVSSITAQRRDAEQELQAALEELEAADRAKDEFIAALSHELRTPLSAIIGWTDLVRLNPEDQETTREAIENIAVSARAQSLLVDDLLDVSRIILGKFNIEKRPMDLVEVVRRTVDGMHPIFVQRALALETTFAETPLPVDGDGHRLGQVVTNLLSNAAKFTPAGGRVRVSLQREDDDALIEVIDNGEGIEPAMVSQIFARFRQAESGTKGGLGLGLAIAKHIVEQHDGWIHAESEGRGRGARFVVRVPLRR